MKYFVKGGATATLIWLLCSTAAQAANFTQTVKHQRYLSQSSSEVDKNLPSATPVPKTLEENREEAVPKAIASILPADTPVVASINTKAEAWSSLSRFQYFQSIVELVSRYLPPDIKFDYTKDIESWLGEEVVLAFLPKTEDSTAILDATFLMLAPIKDETRLQPFLEKFKEKTAEAEERDYKGFTILELKFPESGPILPSPLPQVNRSTNVQAYSASKLEKPAPKKRQRSLAIATLPGYIAVGITAKSIEQLIDTSEANAATLAQNPQYQQASQSLQASQTLFTLYENPTTFLTLLQEISKDPSLSIPVVGFDAINLEQIKEYGSINAMLSTQTEGLRFQIHAYRQTPTAKTLSPQPETILTRMPAATYSAFTGRNLNQQWQVLTTAISAKPELKEWLTKFRDFVRTNSGLDVDKDILSWMEGEYGFFLFPTKGGLFKILGGDFNLGIGLAVQTNNRATADTTLKKLNEFVNSSSSGGIEVNTHTIKGQPVTSWDILGDSSQSLLAYSWVDENTIVVTTGFGAIADLVPQPYILLPSTYNFTTATKSLPHPNYGYFYVNMGSSLSWAYGLVPEEYSNNEYFRTFKQIIGSIYSISATSSTTVDREQFDFLVVLAPTRKQKE
ncbi:Protein of unknown function (DUF3352) [Cylindrospermum stagnale PCC 7417]|uniref:DUF3352 domain-containing protein n=1 Tax=Cylindrospermum stagnale PCC 7417 TaxID=56107 RepID=K9WWV1_9NOST|nr:DUF3352 domain-containing protein [Cylindrospermum stagnale]AFZ23992.1 Protein of unknown function (DUF3352) [Cylindrospermum stagnale PCC 7417]